LFYICGMETEDKISFNYTDGLDIHDGVYRKVIKDFNILYERDKMGGNEGIHFPKHDPSFKIVPISKKKFLENFGEILTMFGELVNFPQR
jgi:hypothetical protein